MSGPKPPELEGDGIYIRTSLVSGGACAPIGTSVEDIETKANLESPTGISSRWKVDGEAMPCLEDDDREHWVLVC